MPPGRDDDALAGERAGLAEELLAAREDLLRLDHASGAVLALGELPLRRPEELDAALGERGGVRLGGRVLPHADVHGRGSEDGPAEGEPELGEDVVGEPVRELGEGVRRERRDDEQVRVDEVGVEVARRLAARERLEGVRRSRTARRPASGPE